MTGLPPVRDVNANDTEFEGKQQTARGPAHQRGLLPDGLRRLLRDDAHPHPPGARLRRGRRRGRDAGGDHQRAAGEGLLSGREPARAAHPPLLRRRGPLAHHRGRREGREAGGLSEETGTELYFHYPQAAARASRRAPSTGWCAPRRPPALAGRRRRARRSGSVDRSLPLADLQSMEANLAGSVSRPRFLALLLAIFAGVALRARRGGHVRRALLLRRGAQQGDRDPGGARRPHPFA